MHAHLVQLDIAWEDRAENVRRVQALLRDRRIAPGDLIVLPEMFDTGFSMNIETTCDREGQTLAALTALARAHRAYVHGARTVRTGDRAENRATIVAPDGSVLLEYAKVHPFSYAGEHRYFASGRHVATWRWAVGDESLTVCPAVCYDLRFPELFRLGLLAGAELFVIGANWPAPRAFAWRTLLLARAIENQAFVLGVNRTGRDPHAHYTGGSLAVDPRGQVLGEMDQAPGVLSVSLDPAAVRTWREEFPAIRDIRLISADASATVLRVLPAAP